MARQRRSLPILALIVMFCSLIGGVLAFAASPETAGLPKDPEFLRFAKVLATLEQNSADKLDMDKAIYNGAMPGMMRTLDPHSNFFDPKEYALIREDQEGHYFGVGMEVKTTERKDGDHVAVLRIACVEGGAAAGRHHRVGER